MMAERRQEPVEVEDSQCVTFLQETLPQLRLRWPGFRKVRRQVCRRLARRLEELGLDSLDDYRNYLAAHPEEWRTLDDFCRITISRFYRDRSVFDYLTNVVLPDLAEAAQRRGDRELRAWSAGCASGEEPYTLVIAWRLELQARFPNVALHITATDSNPTVLARAREAIYPASSLKDLPPAWLTAAFVREGDQWRLRDEFRDRVEFLQQDLRREQPVGPFALILCRHLAFTYFDETLQMQTLEALLTRLLPDGALVTGKQETLPSAARERLVEWALRTGVFRPKS